MSQFRTRLFPWCVVPDAGVGDGTVHPVIVSLDKAMEWYWRVRKWELVVVSDEYGASTFSDLEFPPGNALGATERALICPLDASLHTNRKTGDAVEVNWSCWFYSEFLDFAPEIVTDAIRTDGGDYYPQYVLDMLLDVDVGTPTLSTYERSPYTLSTITMTLDGFPIPLYTTDETGFISVDMYPTEWWPYAPTSGGADVWDTTDGTQLTGLTVID